MGCVHGQPVLVHSQLFKRNIPSDNEWLTYRINCPKTISVFI